MSGALYRTATLAPRPDGTRPLKLNMGCGRATLEGWVNCDLDPAPHVDMAFDVQKDWPLADNQAGVIYASHMIEHLTDPYTFMREAWRVLMPGGEMTLRMPHGSHRAAWWDLTHIRPWFPESFCMFQPGHAACTGNPQHEGWQYPFAIHCVDMRIAGNFRRWLRWRPIRKQVLNIGRSLTEFTEEIWVYLQALKSPEAVAEYERIRPHFGNAVITRWVMYRHQWEGRSHPEPGEKLELMWLEDDKVVAAWADAT